MPNIWFSAIWNTLFKKQKSPWDIIMNFVSAITYITILILVLQQCNNLNNNWKLTTDEYYDSLNQYRSICDLTKENNNRKLLQVCKELTIIINTSPFARAIDKTISSWHSCITMPCSQLLLSISTSLEYKIILILICLYFFTRFYQLFNYTKRKSIKFQDYLRGQYTNKFIQQDMLNNGYIIKKDL